VGLLSSYFIFVYGCAWICADVCRYCQKPQKGVSLELVVQRFGSHLRVPGTKLGSFERASSGFNWAVISPVSEFYTEKWELYFFSPDSVCRRIYRPRSHSVNHELTHNTHSCHRFWSLCWYSVFYGNSSSFHVTGSHLSTFIWSKVPWGTLNSKNHWPKALP